MTGIGRGGGPNRGTKTRNSAKERDANDARGRRVKNWNTLKQTTVEKLELKKSPLMVSFMFVIVSKM